MLHYSGVVLHATRVVARLALRDVEDAQRTRKVARLPDRDELVRHLVRLAGVCGLLGCRRCICRRHSDLAAVLQPGEGQRQVARTYHTLDACPVAHVQPVGEPELIYLGGDFNGVRV